MAGASEKSTMITVATTLPVVFERSVIRGHPPIETSPRPSATGSLHSAVGVLLNAGAVVVVVGAAVVVVVGAVVVVVVVVVGAAVVVVVGAAVVVVVGAVVVVVVGAVPDELVLFAQTNLVPVFLHIYMTPFVFCV